MSRYNKLFKIAPGLAFCCAIAAGIIATTNQIPNSIVDPLIIALVLGIAFKNIFQKAQWQSDGTKFAGKYILEFSVMIMGAGIFLPDIAGAGLPLFILILCGVAGSMLIAFAVGHIILNLSPKLAILIGVSNSICGNAAAAAIAPIIGASSVELASVIAISGLLGATQIILLPLLAPTFGLSEYHYGVVAGMAVYAVSHVYAASATVSATSASVAIFVKLIRVILLAPLIVVVQLLITLKSTRFETNLNAIDDARPARNIAIHQYVPWFVIGFIVLAILRSVEIIGETAGDNIHKLSRYSFLVAMLGIGMGVDFRDILKVGAKVVLVISSVILFMVTISMLAGSHLAFH